jgi:hypothetical protein
MAGTEKFDRSVGTRIFVIVIIIHPLQPGIGNVDANGIAAKYLTFWAVLVEFVFRRAMALHGFAYGREALSSYETLLL